MRILFGLFILFPCVAWGEQTPLKTPPAINKWGQPPAKDVSFSLGVGALIGHNHRIDNQTWPYNAKTYVRVVPVAEFKYKRLRIFGPFANFDLVRTKDWGASLKIGIQGDQYRGLDMEERDWSFFGGASLRYKWIDFSYSRDLQGISEGSTYSLETGPRFPLSQRIFLMTSVGVTYLDKRYADYYYGVRPAEATVDRPTYEIEQAFIYNLSLRPIFRITEHISLMTMVKLSLYSPEITDSPTVRDEPGLSGLVALTYQIL